jgi:hypothetical protein
MADVQLGVLKPDYMAKAGQAQASYGQNMAISRRKSAMARHPSVAGSPRSAEFHAQAQQHLGAAQSNVQTVRSMTAQPAETLSGNFTRSSNPSMN